MLPKIIVTTGCSYGIFFDSFKSFGNVDGLEMILDLHAISLGSTFQAISIIETVEIGRAHRLNSSHVSESRMPSSA